MNVIFVLALLIRGAVQPRAVLLWGGRPRQWILVAIWCLATFECSLAVGEEIQRKSDAYYRTALFEYYQQDYFSALSELMVGEHKHLANHKNKTSRESEKLLRGGIYLSYGMDNLAEKIFGQVATTHQQGEDEIGDRARENRSRAWFYLGKLQHQKGEYATAVDAFERVDKSLTEELHPEYDYLNTSSVLHARPDKPIAPVFDRGRANDSIWRYYREFNTVITKLSSCNINCDAVDFQPTTDEERLLVIERLASLELSILQSHLIDDQEELLNLHDRTNISRGYLYIELQQYNQAITAFKSVRTDSALVNDALLGLGWAAINAGDYRFAIMPMQSLANKSTADSQTLEALLALPFIYNQLGQSHLALSAYATAEKVFIDQLSLLTEISAMLPTLSMEDIIDTAATRELLWLDNDDYRPISSTSNGTNLLVIAEKNARAYQQQLGVFLASKPIELLNRQYRDARWLHQQLQRWRDDIDVLAFTIDARRHRSETVFSPKYMQALRQRSGKLTAALKKIDTDNTKNAEYHSAQTEDSSLRWLMDESQLTNVVRIESAREKVDSVVDAKEILDINGRIDSPGAARLSSFDEKIAKRDLRLLEGLLIWQVNQSSAETQRRYSKQLRQLEQKLNDVELALNDLDHHAGLALSQVGEKGRLENALLRLQRRELDVAQLQSQIEHQLRTDINRQLASRRAEIDYYLAEGRHAKAQLLDTLSYESGDLSFDDANAGEARQKTIDNTIASAKEGEF